ncbi:C40 family peptidase [Sporosarcina cyprini]|uniref:C40 family peptidase n=1 Tax=Sporosarcina cyprini TaxID=2910523 RepID=UPI001EDFEE0B|nr:NlpC/P60 family protein [Sporosarcina cyprini]MCG3088764.1 C40 family peptidase [Sporosarcina cyprini]
MNKKIISAALAATVTLSTLAIPAVNPEPVAAATLASQPTTAAVNAKADQLISTAKSLIGKASYSNTQYKDTYPYKFSCASFLMYVFEKNGVDLGTYNEDYMMKQGTYVAKGQWKKGDLLFFKSKKTGTDPDHVVMYIGNNKVIQMADPKQKIVITDMNSKPYYKDNYVTARRVLPGLMSSSPATKGDKIVESAYQLRDKATIGSVTNPSAMKFTSLGYINYVYKKQNITLPATSLSALMAKGTTVSRANLKKGDLVFFNSVKGSKTPSLVGIYAGEYRIIIPTSSGVQSRVLLVDYYNSHYITAKRFISGN